MLQAPISPTRSPGGRQKPQATALILLFGALLATGIVLVILSQLNREAPPETNYYTGPMYNIRTGRYVDASGRVVSPPEGETSGTPAPASVRRVVE